MASVYGWAVASTDEKEDVARIRINANEDGPDTVELTVLTFFSNLAVELTPKQARELAKDLRAAATAAGAK